MVSSKAPGSGETIGSIDETKAKPKNDQEEKPKSPEILSQIVYFMTITEAKSESMTE